MKTLSALALTSLLIAGNASAYFVGTDPATSVDAGQEDTLLAAWDSKRASTYASWYEGESSGINLEIAITEGVIGGTVTSAEKINGGNEVTAVNVYNGTDLMEGWLAFDLSGNDPGYYLIKNASVKLNEDGTPQDPTLPNDTALFLNNADSGWAVLNWAATGIKNLDNLVISHVTVFNNSVSVPEPATLALLVFGLAGLGAARKYRS